MTPALYYLTTKAQAALKASAWVLVPLAILAAAALVMVTVIRPSG